MATEGFQLHPLDLVADIRERLIRGDASLSIHLDTYARPDWEHGIFMVSDQVDRAVVIFVGSRAQAKQAFDAAQQALPKL